MYIHIFIYSSGSNQSIRSIESLEEFESIDEIEAAVLQKHIHYECAFAMMNASVAMEINVTMNFSIVLVLCWLCVIDMLMMCW